MAGLERRLVAEFLGTAVLVATVVGSGIMADSLTSDTAVALLANAIATGAILYVLITVLGPISGAHFNPAVSLAFVTQGDLRPSHGVWFSIFQIAGAIAGCVVANVMFDLPLAEWSNTHRTGMAQWVSEAVATAGLVATIFLGVRFRPGSVAALVGLYITAAYWFTSSTSFANPAVTLGRMFSDTFAGIAPVDAPAFILIQLITAVGVVRGVAWLMAQSHPPSQGDPS